MDIDDTYCEEVLVGYKELLFANGLLPILLLTYNVWVHWIVIGVNILCKFYYSMV